MQESQPFFASVNIEFFASIHLNIHRSSSYSQLWFLIIKEEEEKLDAFNEKKKKNFRTFSIPFLSGPNRRETQTLFDVSELLSAWTGLQRFFSVRFGRLWSLDSRSPVHPTRMRTLWTWSWKWTEMEKHYRFTQQTNIQTEKLEQKCWNFIGFSTGFSWKISKSFFLWFLGKKKVFDSISWFADSENKLNQQTWVCSSNKNHANSLLFSSTPFYKKEYSHQKFWFRRRFLKKIYALFGR